MRLLVPCIFASAFALAVTACASSKGAEGRSSAAATESHRAEADPRGDEAAAAAERDDWKTARPLFEALARDYPNVQKYWERAGISEQMLGDQTAAEASYQRSIALKDTAKVRFNLGMMQAQRGRLDLASEEFTRAVALDPKYERCWWGIARALLQLGEWPEAIVAMSQYKAMHGAGKDFDELLGMAAAGIKEQEISQDALQQTVDGLDAVMRERPGEARTHFESAVKFSPRFAEAHYNLGAVARQLGDDVTAEKSWREAIAQCLPQQTRIRADAENNLAVLLVRQKHQPLSEAEQLVRHALQLRPGRASYLETLGSVCEASRDVACARDAFEKFLASAEPVPPEIRADVQKRLAVLPK